MKDQREDKDKIVELLKTTPVIGVVCGKAGLARATYYRWLEEDPEFARKTRVAISIGNRGINDLAYGKLIQHINGGKLPAITFLLSRRHPYFKRSESMKHRVQIEESQRSRRLGDIPDLAFRDIVISKLRKKLRKRVVKTGMKLYQAMQAVEDELAKEHPQYWKRVNPRSIPWNGILKDILERGDK